MDRYEEMMLSINTAKATAASAIIFAAAAAKARAINSSWFELLLELANTYKKKFAEEKNTAKAIILELEEGE